MSLYIDKNGATGGATGGATTYVWNMEIDKVGVTYMPHNLLAATVENTGNGFIAKFPAVHSTQQDYYVCLDYSQARDLVLGLAEFKKELGFTE